MAELAKSFITVSDESAYGAGTNAIVPLYVFATQSNKVLDSTTGEIAPGTTIANELLVMTSQRDVINTFGVPYFEKNEGTVQQGSELNEVGLLGLYSAMGSTALAYALRADIDLSQLKPSKEEPKSDPKNGAKWFDVDASTFAVYRCNGGTFTDPYKIRNWDRETVKIYDDVEVNDPVEEDKGTIIYNIKDRHFYEVDTEKKVKEPAVLMFADYKDIPNGSQGNIWVQLDKLSDGSKLIKKTYNATYGNWISSEMGFYHSESEITTSSLLNGANVVIGDNNALTIKKFMGEDANPKFLDDDEIKDYEEETYESAIEGTLWYNDSIKVDIMINNGSQWVGLSNYKDYGSELYVSADTPTGVIKPLSIWVDTNDTTFPTIYRYINDQWEVIDNTDQTSAFGILFADARYYVDKDGTKPTYENKNGKISSNLLTSNYVDPDCPNPGVYSEGMLLFNTRFSSNNVKEYKLNQFEGMYNTSTKKYKINDVEFTLTADTARWVSASGNALDGSGLFGADAQRKMIVEALNGAINSCEELKSLEYDFFYACCPGYPEVDVALNDLNEAKKEMFYIVTDTPKNLKPTVRAITDWGKGGNGSHGMEGRVLRSRCMTRQYPPMGMSSNVDGTLVAIPTSICKMKNLLNLPIGQICAGSQYGVVSNIGSTGYITDENEYAIVSVNEGLGEAIVAQSINPIMMRRNTGLLFWGENTENNGNTSLSDEHGVLTILRLKRELEEAVTPFFFRKNTSGTRGDFNYVLRTILNSYVANEELYDYVLDTDTPNTAETISRKELHAVIAIEIVKGIEFIYIPISVVNTGTLSEQSLIA